MGNYVDYSATGPGGLGMGYTGTAAWGRVAGTQTFNFEAGMVIRATWYNSGSYATTVTPQVSFDFEGLDDQSAPGTGTWYAMTSGSVRPIN